MKKIKITIITIILIVSAMFFWRYFNQYLGRSKATTDKVNITYSSANITAAKNENFNLGVILNAENSASISAVDLKLQYDDKNLIDYVNFQTLPANYFDEKIIESTSSANGIKTLHLVLAAKKSKESLSSSTTINLRFKTTNTDGQTTIGLIGTNQVVGTTEGYSFDLTIPTSATTIVVGNGGPTSTGTNNLSFKVRFQGIINTPVTTTQAVRVIIKKQETTIDEKTINFSYDTTATGETKGRWLGSGSFNVPTGSGYSIFIKGPKHVQKKICDLVPTEALGAEGTYRCASSALAITNTSSFDFSKIMLLAGDLPQQDGVVNSYDISLVRNNLGKTDSVSLASSDINLDGRINTQDYSLIIYALSIRTDEE